MNRKVISLTLLFFLCLVTAACGSGPAPAPKATTTWPSTGTPAATPTVASIQAGRVDMLTLGDVLAAKFSPDGTVIAVGTRVGLMLLDSATFKVLDYLLMEAGIFDIQYSHDGQTILTVDGIGDVLSFNSQNLEQPETLADGSLCSSSKISMSGDKYFCWSKTTFSMSVFDLNTAGRTGVITDREYLLADFSPDGRAVYVVERKAGTIAAYNTSDMSRLWGYQIVNCEGNIVSLATSPAGDQLALGCENGRVFLVPTNYGDEVGHFETGGGSVYGLSYSPDQTLLGVGTPEGVVSLWDTSTRQAVNSFQTADPVDRVTFSPDARQVLTIEYNNDLHEAYLRLYDAANGSLLGLLSTGSWSSFDYLNINRNGDRLLASLADAGIEVWDPARGTLQYSQPETDYRVASTIQGDLFIFLWDDSIEVHRMADGSLQSSIPEAVDAVLLLDDNKTLLGRSASRGFFWWNAQDGTLIRDLELPNGRDVVAHAGDLQEDELLVLLEDGSLQAVDASSGEVKRTYVLQDANGNVLPMELSWMDNILISGNQWVALAKNQIIRVWNLDTGQLAMTLDEDGRVAFSGDGARLAVATRGGLSVYDIAAGLKVAAQDFELDLKPDALAFDPTGRRVVYSISGAIFSWTLDP